MAEGRRAGKTTTRRSGSTLGKIGDGLNAVRRRVAPLVWLVFVVLAAFLVLGAVLVALGANETNPAVELVLGVADSLDLGIFSRTDGIFTFDGSGAQTKAALANWGLAALLYLVVGRVLRRVVYP